MEEQEAPLEDVHEEIHHHAEHAQQRWVLGVALSTAVIAALAAICSLLSGDNANEAMMEQIQCADKWSEYQTKGIKSQTLASKVELLDSDDKPVKESDRRQLAKYRADQEQKRNEAEELQASSKRHLQRHKTFAYGVTLFQIAIAVSAISVLTRQRWFWLIGLGFGAAGVVFLSYGLMLRS